MRLGLLLSQYSGSRSLSRSIRMLLYQFETVIFILIKKECLILLKSYFE